MSQRRFQSLLLFLLLAITRFSLAGSLVRVDEERTQLEIKETESRLKLGVTRAQNGELPVHINLQLLDPKDRVINSVSNDVTIRPGSGIVEIPLGRLFSDFRKEDQADYLWYRLRYRLTPAGSAMSAETVEGVLSVSEICPQPFQLKIGVPRSVAEGARCRIHVFATRPASRRPVRGVTVTGLLEIHDGDRKSDLKADSITNSSGYAGLDFELPSHLEDPDARVGVRARLGGIVKELSEDLEFLDRTQILLSVDKPLYQPGQALRVRVLAFDATKKALSQAPLTLSIVDQENTEVYRSELTTSRFGEAHAEWHIPENARLGDYSIEVFRKDGSPRDARAGEVIKISRYDLPNFTLSVKPDRSFYLADQNAEVCVRADYLFGQPLKQGHVRVVRETERLWNYREQKYDIKVGESVEGELDAQGQFLARIDLGSEYRELSGDDYLRYRDLRYAAYVTDPTTNRTEQRLFDLRLTKKPIHIYVSQNRALRGEGFPLEFFLSTFYADGTPAKCEVAIREIATEAEHNGVEIGAVQRGAPLLRIVKTNRYGVAKVTNLRTAYQALANRDNLALLFTAKDGKEGNGEQTDSLWSDDRPVIRIHTNRTLYRTNEALEVEVESSLQNGKLVLDIEREGRVLYSGVVRLRKAKGFVVIPYVPEFQDELTLAAYLADGQNDGSYDPPYGVRKVLYPRNRELKVDLRPGQATYEPGQEVSTAIRVGTAEAVVKESLLGVVVLDKAVEERARTDNEFGSTYGFYRTCASLLGFDRELSGLTRRDLDRLDMTQPVPDDLELAADALLNMWPDYYPPHLSQDVTKPPQEVFRHLVEAQLAPLKKALEDRYAKDGAYPRDEATLRKLIFDSKVNLDNVKDPWDRRYRLVFSTDRNLDTVEMISAGPDKHVDSSDDIRALRLAWPYFRSHGENLNRAVSNYHQRTRGFVRDLDTLGKELLEIGETLDSWRDRWGQPYRVEFGILATHFTVTVRSSGPNRMFEALDALQTDDFPLWTAMIDYTGETRIDMDHALNQYYHEGHGFPETPSQFEEALAAAKVAPQNLIDPWGHRFYPVFKTEHRYSGRPTIVTYAEHLRISQQHSSLTPVTGQIQYLLLRSAGPDGTEGTSDDFDVATFSRLLTEQSSRDSVPKPVLTAPILQGFSGAITGTITDPAGAVVPGATVTATDSPTGQAFEAKSDETGRYLLRNLPPGHYKVRFEMRGFRANVIRDVPVLSSSATQLNVTLNVGEVTQTVEVSAGPAVVQTEASALAKARDSFSMQLPAQVSTPRVREYFPETLVWQPSLETDRNGRAKLKFKLADNITTWKMAVIASTVDGRIGRAEKEILAFQPFFLEHDPPRILTEGDEISLPVVLRNYLKKDQSVDLSIKPEGWFSLQGAANKKATLKAGESGRETFDFKATASIKQGKQRITALGSGASDSIEKPVTVHPDGEELTQTVTQIFKELSQLELTIPTEAIPNSARAELKIYPNLMAHVVESVEGILQRPYGCGEQTISSSYPSLMLLRYYAMSGTESKALAQKVNRYLRAGYERLLGYRTEDGGISYWGRGAADVALTAYALRFLHDASGLITVNEEVLRKAYDWLLRQQQPDGSWGFKSRWGESDRQRTMTLTAFVARVLSRPGLREVMTAGSPASKQTPQRDPLHLALGFLQADADESDEPYAVASLALTALNMGEMEIAKGALERLETMAKKEGDVTYWHLETNTPFFGWGLPGRLETTALAVQALALARELGIPGSAAQNRNPTQHSEDSRDKMIRQALLFLLRNKDRYGIWYSTQATVNVLDALLSLLGTGGSNTNRESSAEILINGAAADRVSFSQNNQPANPITVELSKFLMTGINHIEVRRNFGVSEATVQLLETHYVPWMSSSAARPKADAGSASALRLSIRFDQTEAKIGDEINCHVEAERIGFRGYGMLLGEVGLPPGAEVDRASLDEAIKSAGWDLYQYDVLPDRLIVYLWPRAGGTKFNFKFRPRYGLKAQTSPSVVYDYYNPEAKVVVKPTSFVVR